MGKEMKKKKSQKCLGSSYTADQGFKVRVNN